MSDEPMIAEEAPLCACAEKIRIMSAQVAGVDASWKCGTCGHTTFSKWDADKYTLRGALVAAIWVTLWLFVATLGAVTTLVMNDKIKLT